jgi:hypothetical protein
MHLLCIECAGESGKKSLDMFKADPDSNFRTSYRLSPTNVLRHLCIVCAGESGKTSLEMFKADPDSLRVELEPLRDDTSNLEMHFSFQVRPGGRQCSVCYEASPGISPFNLFRMMTPATWRCTSASR